MVRALLQLNQGILPTKYEKAGGDQTHYDHHVLSTSDSLLKTGRASRVSSKAGRTAAERQLDINLKALDFSMQDLEVAKYQFQGRYGVHRDKPSPKRQAWQFPIAPRLPGQRMVLTPKPLHVHDLANSAHAPPANPLRSPSNPASNTLRRVAASILFTQSLSPHRPRPVPSNPTPQTLNPEP
ncbi:hypothetical protein T484DRAFT_2174686 [Baffinella frigidus]|nr:hypothetical protein T484DRAFT_2174686 [Cryptophyta sp. CCMP2293]